MHEVTTAEELDALPVGSVVRDSHGSVHVSADEALGDPVWMEAGSVNWHQTLTLAIRGPLTVLFRPDAPQPATTDDWDTWAERVAEQIPEDYVDGETDRDIIERGIARLLIELGRHWDEGFAAGQHIANQPTPTTDAATVERVARVLYEQFAGITQPTVNTWGSAQDEDRAFFGDAARDALAAARAGEAEARPAGCCGKCPPIMGGGYDCTCDGNPRCQHGGEVVDREVLIRLFDQAAIDYATGKSDVPPSSDGLADAALNYLAARGDTAPTEVEWGVRADISPERPPTPTSSRDEALFIANTVNYATAVQRDVHRSAWREVTP